METGHLFPVVRNRHTTSGRVALDLEYLPRWVHGLNSCKLIAIEPGFTFYYKQINLESAKGFYPQYNLFVRLCLRDLISFGE
ncbi:hypothetical protein MASR1M74_09120 [Lentimicrobium sp.]